MAGLELQGGRSTQSTATPDVAPQLTFEATQTSDRVGWKGDPRSDLHAPNTERPTKSSTRRSKTSRFAALADELLIAVVFVVVPITGWKKIKKSRLVHCTALASHRSPRQ
jgi:hypothetical protein